jgi:hypothetical protein
MTLHSVLRARIPFVRPRSDASEPAAVIVESGAAFPLPVLGILDVARLAMVALRSKVLSGTLTWAAEHST